MLIPYCDETILMNACTNYFADPENPITACLELRHGGWRGGPLRYPRKLRLRVA